QEQAQALTQAVSTFRLSGSHATPTAVKRNNRPAVVAKLPNRGPVTRKAAMKSETSTAAVPVQPRKAAAGGGDDWEEF
ncbi:MAG: methyl-accepting chemotaxis protein, partial [Proteobacteria bacterium]|nr:methyl-accepting chemotaxis protein [Pseudomonadota bacterium]